MTRHPLELTVWFDGDCGLCRRVAAWLDRQPKFVPLRCRPAQDAASAGCPLGTQALLDKVTVTASDGAVYRGTNAWITALWALRGYRRWSLRFARPRWRPAAASLFGAIAGVAKMTKK